MVNWRKLIFGGVDSSDYGIYITGEGVYNAPERAVEFVDVPGRNGAIAIDQGRFNNITVTYPAGTFGMSQEEFREAVSDFRNAVISLRGYQRLEDTYHPDEYRMAIYTAGLEVSPTHYGTAGEFSIEFECKPQRWLTSGETATAITSGGTLNNPTSFNAGPLLEIEGYGSIAFNGFTVTLANGTVGDLTLIPRDTYFGDSAISKTYTFETDVYNDGDTITIPPVLFEFLGIITPGSYGYESVSYSISTSSTMTPTVTVPDYSGSAWGPELDTTISSPQLSISVPSASAAAVTKTAVVTVTGTKTTSGTDTITLTAEISVTHSTMQVSMSSSSSNLTPLDYAWHLSPVHINSTVNLLGHPTYIDCETGEAYRTYNGETESLNAFVTLGADLPSLAPGNNSVTFSNTITSLKIAPRWWRV